MRSKARRAFELLVWVRLAHRFDDAHSALSRRRHAGIQSETRSSERWSGRAHEFCRRTTRRLALFHATNVLRQRAYPARVAMRPRRARAARSRATKTRNHRSVPATVVSLRYGSSAQTRSAVVWSIPTCVLGCTERAQKFERRSMSTMRTLHRPRRHAGRNSRSVAAAVRREGTRAGATIRGGRRGSTRRSR